MRSEELSKERGAFRAVLFDFIDASRKGAGLQFTSSTAERFPFPSRGRTIAQSQLRLDLQCRAALQCFARRNLKVSRPIRGDLPQFRLRLSLPLLRGRGTACGG